MQLTNTYVAPLIRSATVLKKKNNKPFNIGMLFYEGVR